MLCEQLNTRSIEVKPSCIEGKNKVSLELSQYYRGYVFVTKKLGITYDYSIEKLYFVLDSESGVIKLFKSPESITARDSYSLYGGIIKKSESILLTNS